MECIYRYLNRRFKINEQVSYGYGRVSQGSTESISHNIEKYEFIF